MRYCRFQRVAFPTFHGPTLAGLASFAPTDELHEARVRRALRQLATIEPLLGGDIAVDIERRDSFRVRDLRRIEPEPPKREGAL